MIQRTTVMVSKNQSWMNNNEQAPYTPSFAENVNFHTICCKMIAAIPIGFIEIIILYCSEFWQFLKPIQYLSLLFW